MWLVGTGPFSDYLGGKDHQRNIFSLGRGKYGKDYQR